MERLLIKGGRPLYGTVATSGMKNSAVAILFATILTEDRCIIENVPSIMDVTVAIKLLEEMGARVSKLDETTVEVDTREVCQAPKSDCLVRKMRASYYLLGAELGRFGACEISYPGGCDFGQRPIDQHLKAFCALGAECNQEEGYIKIKSEKALQGAKIDFDVVSVGATVNALLAAVTAQGTTVLSHAAKEPHVQDLERFLLACGAKMDGIGTDTVTIVGGEKLHGCRFRISDDMIEAGTYLIAAAACGGDVCVTMDSTSVLAALIEVLRAMGVSLDQTESTLRLRQSGILRPISVVTGPYPAFPTDLQPQIGVLMAITMGESRLYERVWASRFQYLTELRKMGAQVKVEGDCATFYGVPLYGAEVSAQDLRAGAAMLIAGLCAQGKTILSDLHHIERGYANLLEKFSSLGAEIEKREE